MLFRLSLFAALLTAPLVLQPSALSAQERGLARAEISTAQAEAVAAWYNNRAVRRPTALPRGLRNLVEVGKPLPPGIRRTRSVDVGDIVPPDEGDGEDTGDDGSDYDDLLDLLLVGEDLVLVDSETGIVLDIEFDLF